MRAPGGPDVAVGDVLLAVEDVSLVVRRREGAQRRLLRHPQGRNPRHHRPERRRQDLDAQRHQRLLSAAAGPHHLQGRDARADAAARGGAWRHRAHVPERRAVPRHDRARQHHGRPHAEDAQRTSSGSCCATARRCARRSSTAAASRRSSTSSRSRQIRTRAGRPAALRPAEARRARPRARDGAGPAAARRADGRHEPRRERGHVALHPRRERSLRHHDRADRARHGRGDGPVRPRRRARLRHARSPTARRTRSSATRR